MHDGGKGRCIDEGKCICINEEKTNTSMEKSADALPMGSVDALMEASRDAMVGRCVDPLVETVASPSVEEELKGAKLEIRKIEGTIASFKDELEKMQQAAMSREVDELKGELNWTKLELHCLLAGRFCNRASIHNDIKEDPQIKDSDVYTQGECPVDERGTS